MPSEKFTILIEQHGIAPCPVFTTFKELTEAFPLMNKEGVIVQYCSATDETVTVTCPPSEAKEVLAIMAAVIERYYPT